MELLKEVDVRAANSISKGSALSGCKISLLGRWGTVQVPGIQVADTLLGLLWRHWELNWTKNQQTCCPLVGKDI